MPLRSDLPPLPERIRRLPVDESRGFPVPWFVAWVGGKPEFRVADGQKLVRAIHEKLCWVCGDRLGRRLAFVIGPMCAINRVSAEPPCHRECAEFSLRACPFLARPQMDRREGNLPEGTGHAGMMIRRNPGAMLLWVTREYQLVGDGEGGILFRVGDPDHLSRWREGRPATVAELREAFDSGLPILKGVAESEGPAAVRELEAIACNARLLLGIA